MKKQNLTLIFIILLLTSCASENKLSAIYDKVAIYAEEGSPEKVIDLLKTEVPILSRDYKYYYILGVSYNQMDNFRANRRVANENFMKAYKFDNARYNNTYYLAGTFEDLQDTKRAKKYFMHAIEIWETPEINHENFAYEPYFRYARLLSYERDFKQALMYIEKSLETPIFEADSLLLKGFILANLGNFDDLAKYYEKALEIAPDEPLIKKDYGRMLIELGMLDKAYAFFSDIKNDTTLSTVDHYYATVELAYLELLNGNFDVALLYLQETKSQLSSYLPLLKYWVFYEWKIKDFNDAYNSYKTYRFIAENLESVKWDDKSVNNNEFFKYFEDDIYFQELQKPKLPAKRNKTIPLFEESIAQRDYGKKLIESGEYQKAYDFFLDIKNDASLTEVDYYYAKVELSYLELLNGNYDKALSYLNDASYVGFSNYLPYIKYRMFYYLSVHDLLSAYDWYKLYKFAAEDLESVNAGGEYTSLTEFLVYFKNDVYFEKLNEKIEFSTEITLEIKNE